MRPASLALGAVALCTMGACESTAKGTAEGTARTGEGAVEGTGTAGRGAVEGTGEVVEGVRRDLRGQESGRGD
jgi:hypothetical protein